MKFIAFVFLLAYFTKEGTSLDCYTCNDCQRGFMNEENAIQTCPAPLGIEFSQCYKEVEDDGDVNRGCLTDAECVFQESLSKCSENQEKECYICCDGDKCNSASFTAVSWMTVLGTCIMMLCVHVK